MKLSALMPSPRLTSSTPSKFTPVIIMVSLSPGEPEAKLTPVIVGCGTGTVTVKPPGSVVVPPGVLMETILVPSAAVPSIARLAVIWVDLFTVKLVTVMPAPKSTVVALLRLLPVITTPNAWP